MLTSLILALLAQNPEPTRRFLATGGSTVLVGSSGQIEWSYSHSTRDGWALPDGTFLLALSKSKSYPSGAVVEVDRDQKILFLHPGTQSEVDTLQPLPDGRVLLTESGPKPRLLEVDREGKVVVEVPLRCQVKNFHMQTRMARKLPNGNYLVPHLLDRVVREYKADGTTAWEAKTPDAPKDSWPFTAIRLEDGNTLVTCTHGNMVIEFDAKGEVAWTLTNADLPKPLLNDPCGAQRLPNGNTVICSYATGAKGIKLLEVTRDKKLVWTHSDERPHGIHEVHVIETDGRPVEGAPRR
jgi:outer membrane protein assembly factor BamB